MNTARNCTCLVDLVPAPQPNIPVAIAIFVVLGVALVAGLVGVIACRKRTAQQAPLLANNRDGNSQMF